MGYGKGNIELKEMSIEWTYGRKIIWIWMVRRSCFTFEEQLKFELVFVSSPFIKNSERILILKRLKIQGVRVGYKNVFVFNSWNQQRGASSVLDGLQKPLIWVLKINNLAPSNLVRNNNRKTITPKYLFPIYFGVFFIAVSNP